MVLCSSLYTVQSSLETVQGLCMGEYAAATGSECVGAARGASVVTKKTTDAATAATCSSSSHSPSQENRQPQLSSKNRAHSSNNERSRWSTGTQTARTFASDRFMEYLPDNPFFANNSLYDDNNNDEDDDDEDEEHNQFKMETAAFFRSCAGEDCLTMPAATTAAVAPERRSVADLLFSVDTEDGSSLRTPWTRNAGAGPAAAAAATARQEPRYLQKPLAAAASHEDDGAITPNNRHSSPKKDRHADHDNGESQQRSNRSHYSGSGTRSKRKKRPAYIVLYRPRTPWPLERLDIVWNFQVILDESTHSSSLLASPTSVQSSRRGGGSGRLTVQPCASSSNTTTTTTTTTIMDKWTGLLQDEERVEIGRITGYNIHSSQQLDELVNNNSSNHRRHYHQYAVADPAVLQFAKTILNPASASAAAATETTDTLLSEGGAPSSTAAARQRQRPDMGPIFLITDVYVCPEYRGTGLGLFLVDVACRRVADPLALVVLSCGNNIKCSSDVANHHDTRQEPAAIAAAAAANVQAESSSSSSSSREVVQLYFGLLGFAPISEQFLARRNGRHCPRVEEVCPHMPRNAVSNSTMAAAASSSNEATLQQTQRQPSTLSLAPPS